jgi:hypothetical protein
MTSRSKWGIFIRYKTTDIRDIDNFISHCNSGRHATIFSYNELDPTYFKITPYSKKNALPHSTDNSAKKRKYESEKSDQSRKKRK